jgi:hypothetical protein
MVKRSAIERAVESLSGQSDERQAPAPRPRASRKNARKSRTGRHARKCNVCRHPDRKAIEQDFLHWRSADQIAKDYGIADHSSIYRHAHASGLFDRRANTIRLALSPLIERAMTVEVTADSVIRAVELLARLNGDGQLINPPKHVIHHSSRPTAAPPDALQHPASSVQPPEPNRQNARVEHHANH